jgi:hypothetical protein
MRHARALAVAIPASLVLIAGVVLLTTSGATAAKGPTYTAKATKTGLENANGGIHPGSAWFAHGNLLNATHHDVGKGYIRCELNVNKFWQCTASAFFSHKGQLTSEGAFRLDQHTGPFSFAVTGGTGDYAHASGSISIRIVSGMRAQFTLNL